MASSSGIEWTQATWNPTVGCTKVSPGCKHCYAATLHGRLSLMGSSKYSIPFSVVRPFDAHLRLPLKWKRPRMIFVNSMSDLFHEDLPFEYVTRVFNVMATAQQHVFQVLTKRSQYLLEKFQELPWPENVWMGVSIESEQYTFRANHLARVPAAVRFLSVEPLLGPIRSLPLDGIDWVIAGGESGHGARPMHLEWARSLRDQCTDAGVAFFLKQLGGIRDKRGGSAAILDGQTWRQLPTSAPAPSRSPTMLKAVEDRVGGHSRSPLSSRSHRLSHSD